jgi:hypothetical protein
LKNSKFEKFKSRKSKNRKMQYSKIWKSRKSKNLAIFIVGLYVIYLCCELRFWLVILSRHNHYFSDNKVHKNIRNINSFKKDKLKLNIF